MSLPISIGASIKDMHIVSINIEFSLTVMSDHYTCTSVGTTTKLVQCAYVSKNYIINLCCSVIEHENGK